MPKILYIDDDEKSLIILSSLLKNIIPDCTVSTVLSGAEGIKKAKAELPDSILLDIKMPNMDGFQLLEMRERDPVLRGIPIIVVSARDPAGQPIVSSTLAVTQGGGLSTRQLLMGIEFISRVLSVTGQVGAPMRTEALVD